MTSLRIAFDSSDAVRGAKAGQDALRALGAEARKSELDLERLSDVNLDLGNLRLGLGPDPLGVRAAVASATAALSEFDEAKRRAQFGAGVLPGIAAPTAVPFGAGLGLDTLKADLATASAEAEGLGVILSTAGTSGASAFAAARGSVRDLAAETIGAAERTRELFSLQRQAPTVVTASPFSGATDLGGITTIDPRGVALLEAQRQGFVAARTAAGQYAQEVRRSGASATASLDLHLASILRISAAVLGIRSIRAVFTEVSELGTGIVDLGQASGLTGSQLDDLARKLERLSISAGAPTNDILKLGAAAGRLQIRTPEGIEQFVRDVALLDQASPKLADTVDQLGERVGRLLKLTGEGPSRVIPLADAIARLDDQFGASGAAILSTTEAVAQAGSGFVKSASDAAGLGAAMASLGVDGSQAAQAFGQVIVKVRDAVREGGATLETVASLTGLSGEQIKEALNTDAPSLFISILEGLNRQGGESAQALTDLGLSAVKGNSAIAPLIQNTDQLRRALDQARDAVTTGGDAAADAAKNQDTLSNRVGQTRNVLAAVIGTNTGLAQSLSNVIDFGNQVAASLFGVETSSNQAASGAELTASALERAAIAGAGALVVSKVATGYGLLTAELAVAKTATDLYTGAAITQTVVTDGLSAALLRAKAASIAFITSPLGIAVATGAAVAGIIALSRALNDIDTSPAVSELDDVISRMQKLDGVAAGLEDARDIVFRADLSGDADAKLDGLRRRLTELKAAQTAIASEARAPVEALEPQFRKAVVEGEGGSLLNQADVQTRTQAAIAAAVAALEIPRLSPDKAAELRASIEDAFKGIDPGVAAELRASVERAVGSVQIPASKLGKLKIDDLGLDVHGAGLNLSAAVEQALSKARADASDAASKALSDSIEIDPSGLGSLGAALSNTLDPSTFFPSSFRDALGQQTEEVFGQEVGNRARAVIDNAIRGIDFPGIPKEKSAALRDSINAALTVVSGGEVDTSGVQALERGLDAAGVSAQDATRLISGAMDAGSGEVNAEGIRLLSVLMDQAGVATVGATSALKGIQSEIELTGLEIEAFGKKKVQPTEKLSDFYLDESRRIKGAIRDAELSVNSFSVERGVERPGETTIERPPDLRGFAARRAALLEEREAYEQLLAAKLKDKDVSQRLKPNEASGLRAQADDLLAAKDAALELQEAERRLGAEQDVISKSSGILSQQLQLLGDRAQGDTAQAFELMRRQIELTREEAEKGIQAREIQGDPGADEIAKLREMADAERDLAIESLNTRRVLVEQGRAISELGQAADTFSGAATDALLGLRDPAEAARAAVLDLARSFIQPQLKASFLGLFHDKEKEDATGIPSNARVAAEQGGVGDLFRKTAGDGPAIEPAPPATLGAQAAIPALDFTPLEAAITASAPQVELLGTGSEVSAGGVQHLGAASELTAASIERLGAMIQAAYARSGAEAAITPAAAVDGAAAAQGLQAGAQALATPEATADTVKALATTGASGEVATAGLTAAGGAGNLASAGLTAANVAALQLVAGLNAAFQAAIQQATQVGVSAVAGALGGGAPPGGVPIKKEFGGVLAHAMGGVLAFARGGRPGASAASAPSEGARAIGAAGATRVMEPPSVAELSGSVVSRPTLALIGEGRDREAVLPVDARGGLRGVGARGEAVSLPLHRDAEGKLGVRVPPSVLWTHPDAARELAPAQGSPRADASWIAPKSRPGRVAAYEFGDVVEFARGGKASAVGGARAAVRRQPAGLGQAPAEPLQTVGELSGSVISRPTYALIRQGRGSEGVFPLDARGSVRGLGPSGEVISLPLRQGSDGKLEVHVPEAAALERFDTSPRARPGRIEQSRGRGAQSDGRIAQYEVGGVVELARGGRVGGGHAPSATETAARSQPRMQGQPELQTVGELSGTVLSRPTYALIGEGRDREGVFPLDARGGVRATGPSGEPVSMPLHRDSAGVLGVRLEAGVTAKAATMMGARGAPGAPGLSASGGSGGAGGAGAPGAPGPGGRGGSGGAGGPGGRVQDQSRVQAFDLGGTPGWTGATSATEPYRSAMPFAMGGVAEDRRSSSAAFRTPIPEWVSYENSRAPIGGAGGARVVDQRQTHKVIEYHDNSTVIFGGQSRTPMDGMRYSVSQSERNLMQAMRRLQ